MTSNPKQKKGTFDFLIEKQFEEKLDEFLNKYYLSRSKNALGAVKTFLNVATFQKVGVLPNDFWPDNLDASAMSSKILAEMCVDLAWSEDSKELKEIEDMVKQAKKEIYVFYSIIKSIGIKGVENREKKWKEACLNNYNVSNEGFQFIKRSYLVDDKIYAIDDRNPKRDFYKKLLYEIALDKGFEELSQKTLYKIHQRISPRKIIR